MPRRRPRFTVTPAGVMTFDIPDGEAMRLIISGDREWSHYNVMDFTLCFIQTALREAGDVACVMMHGDCRGADKMAAEIGRQIGWHVIAKPYFSELGRAGGVVRNEAMLHEHKPHLVVGFHRDIRDSTGTKHMLTIAAAEDVRTVLVDAKAKASVVTLS